MIEFEVLDHGVDHPSYFTGCGVAFTRWTDCVTGVGSSAREAAEDAADSMYQTSSDLAGVPGFDAALDSEIAKLSDADDAHAGCADAESEEHAEACELLHFVSIRWRRVEEGA